MTNLCPQIDAATDTDPFPPAGRRALGKHIHDASRALRRKFEAQTRDGALSSAQWLVLVMLYTKGPMRQARLAELVGVEPISVSRTLDRMEKAGLIARQPDPEDRRAHIVAPTSHALQSLGDIEAAAARIFAAAFAGFSAEELARLGDYLTRLNDNLAREADADAASSETAPSETAPDAAVPDETLLKDTP